MSESSRKIDISQAKPCPFCGSTDLTDTMWCNDEGEFTAIMCKSCEAEAPFDVWNMRHNGDYSLIEELAEDSTTLAELKSL